MKNKKTVNIILLFSGIITVVICGVMNFILIPEIESATQGIRCFDMNFGYSYEDAVNFLSLISENGKRVYLNIQLPLDFFYPVAYGTFFTAAFYKVRGGKNGFMVLPVLLMASDYAENIFSVFMLKSGNPGITTVTVAGAVTIVKTVLMYITILLLVIMTVIYFLKKRKADAKNTNA